MSMIYAQNFRNELELLEIADEDSRQILVQIESNPPRYDKVDAATLRGLYRKQYMRPTAELDNRYAVQQSVSEIQQTYRRIENRLRTADTDLLLILRSALQQIDIDLLRK